MTAIRPESKLHQLARWDFHQDWELSSPTPEGIVRAFAANESPPAVQEVVDDIVEALSHQPVEQHLEQLWSETYDSNFLPEFVGLTYREWFLRMLEILRTG